VVHEYVTEGNKYLTAGDTTKVEETVAAVRAMLNILGVDPMSATWDVGSSSSSEMKSAIDALVAVALDQRKAARERKDYAAADSIRDQLAAAGIAIEDTPEGPRWSLDDKGN
jgi:cysteinyl-tRNA synthetase